MSRSVEVDDKAEPVVIPARVLAELRQHALETSPEECCGLLLGDENARYQLVRPCENIMNQRHAANPLEYPRTAKTAFWMSETDYQKAEHEADEHGLKVTAVFHSHVGVSAYLSDEDLHYIEQEGFPFHDADQIVVAVPVFEKSEDGQPQLAEKDVKPWVAVFRREAPGSPFGGHAVLEPRS